jgi:dihydroorotate dehydrogenase (NAD+) catalytic subunit
VAENTLDLSTTLGRLKLPNPILVASGTFGYARESAGFVDLARLGGIVPKTVTRQPRAGNRPPRIVETASGMLNSIGLDNDGIDHFIEHHVPYLSQLGTRVIANVAGKSEDEFPELVAQLDPIAGVDAIELNLSCPNVSGGTDFATRPEVTQRVVRRCRDASSKPLFAKLTPNVTDIVSIADAARSGGADAVTLINTLVGTAIDWRRRKPILSNVVGGLSGPAIKPVALRMVLSVAQKVDIPIIGVGGITTLDDVMEFLVAGASAVQLGTVHFFDPTSSMRLLDQLSEAVASLGAQSIKEIVGSVQLPR